jgi:chemotaxis protein MotA
MSLPTVIGFSLSLLLLLVSILELTTNFKIFLHLSGIAMVIGGTLAATLVAYEARYVKAALGTLKSIFSSPKMTRDMLTNEVARIVRWAYMVQKSGVQAVESDAKSVKGQDAFLGFGINLVISGYTGAEVRQMLENMIETTFQRRTVSVEILKYMASNAPAFGMIATLIGLVVMLDSMGSDPSGLGAGMAVGLLGTLYGVLFARLAIMPAAEKVHQRESIVRFRSMLVAEGLALLADRRQPRFIQDAMNSFLDYSIHFDIDKAPKKA